MKNATITFFFCLLSIVLRSQEVEFSGYDGNKKLKFENNRASFHENGITHEIITNSSTNLILKAGEEIKVIVEFNGIPLVLKNVSKESISKEKEKQGDIFTQFEKDLKNIYKKNNKSKFKNYKLNYKYQNSFFGLSAVINSNVIPEINKLSYVKKIHIVKSVKSTIDESISITHVDLVWNELGLEGEGIVIGILDTGIDYNNENLGGGIGEGHRIIDGYDFVNDDDDPMDDHLHGTHVAGIVAGNGPDIIGVAPKAKMVVYKVLDERGYGYNDDIIAAIERCTDPNNDGDFSDKLDIVNMSLGGSGSFDDAQSIAVDNASELGIVFCVAAGNNGREGFTTTESPGTAKNAITVGATDKNDEIADFSSSGPNLGIYGMKPEIVAPGVNILSCVLNNQVETHSGTSMSTPIVAGICALFKELHPEWGFLEMKSAMMSTAKNLNIDIMKQGAGRVDAYKACNVNTVLSPSNIDFNLLNIETGIYSSFDTIEIKNISENNLEYTFEFPVYDEAITVETNLTIMLIPAGEIKKLVVRVNVDVDNLSIDLKDKSSLSGIGYIYNQNDTISIPWFILAGKKVVLLTNGNQFNGSFVNDVHHHDVNTTFIFPNVSDTLYREEYITNEGENKYDVFVQIDSYKFFSYQNKFFKPLDTLYLFKDHLHNVKFDYMDESGNDFPSGSSKEFMITFVTDIYHRYLLNIPYRKTLQFNTTESKNLIFHNLLVKDFIKKNIYTIQHPVANIKNDTVLKNIPADYRKKDVVLNYPGTNKINFLFSYPSMSTGIIQYAFNYSGKSWKGTLYLQNYSELKPSAFSTCFSLDNDSVRGLLNTIPIWAYRDSIGSFYNLQHNYEKQRYSPYEILSAATYKTSQNTPLIFEQSPVYLYINSMNNIDINGHLYTYSMLRGQLSERIESSSKKGYLLNNENEILDTNYFLEDTLELNIYKSKFITQTKTDYVVGTHTIISTFNLEKDDANAPVLTSFQIRNSENIPINTFKTREEGMICFSVADFQPYIDTIDSNSNIKFKYNTIPIDSVKAYYKNSENDHWNPTRIKFIAEDSIVGYYFKTYLQEITNPDSAFIDFKLQFYDESGNFTEATWKPCFNVRITHKPIINDDYFKVPVARLWESDSLGILKNDLNPNADVSELDLFLVENTKHGQLHFLENGKISYFIDENYFETDTFYYAVSNAIYTSDTAMVILDIDSTFTTLDNINRKNQNIQVYPNPFSDEINVTLNNNTREEIFLEVYDVQGKQLSIIQKYSANNIKLTSSELNIVEDGIYFIKFIFDNKIEIKRINHFRSVK